MELDSLTLLYVIIALSIVQFMLMRYYVASNLETEIHQNNKKIIKRVTGQIQTTLQQHLGDVMTPDSGYERIPQKETLRRRPTQPNRYKEQEQPIHIQEDDRNSIENEDNQMDSMDDPVGADDGDQ